MLSSQALLIFGAATVAVFITMLTVEGVRRPGYRVGLALAAVFDPDPVRGFPPGASSRTLRPTTVHAKLHKVSGSADRHLLALDRTPGPHLTTM